MVFEVVYDEDHPPGRGLMIIFEADEYGRKGEIICMLPEAEGERLHRAINADTDRMIKQALDATCDNLGRWLADLARMKAGRPIRPLDFSVPLPAHMHIVETDPPYESPGDAALDHPRRLQP